MNCSVDLDLTLPNIVAQKEVDFEILMGDI